MMRLDHLVVVAPSLEDGAAHVAERLGLEMATGGAHPQMGTYNRLLRLGDDVYLEVIAVDPDAPAPAGVRWFGLGRPERVAADWAAGRRLRSWVARTDDLDGVLRTHGRLFGEARPASRGARSWRFAVPPDGAPPLDGVAPHVIQWEVGGNPAPELPDVGARLVGFEARCLQVEFARKLFEQIGIEGSPSLSPGETALGVWIDTPAGRRYLS